MPTMLLQNKGDSNNGHKFVHMYKVYIYIYILYNIDIHTNMAPPLKGVDGGGVEFHMDGGSIAAFIYFGGV